MENSKELEGIIRSLLVSNPKVTKVNVLERDYEETEGQRFPFRQLGFRSFLDYLKSIPHVVRLEPFNSNNPDVLPIVTKEISHINQLVTKQRSTVPRRKRNVSRRGGFSGYGRGGALPRRRPSENIPPPRVVPTTYKVPTTNDPDVMENVVWDVVKLVASSKPSGVYVSDIERHIRGKYSNEQLRSNGIHSAQDLLSHASDMVECVNQKVYPKLSYPSGITTATKEQPEGSQHMGIPAGMEEDFEDYEDDDFNNIKYDDDFFENLEEETISTYTIQRCTERLLNSKRNNQSAAKGDEEGGHAIEEECFPEDHECNMSKVMINNFRSILAKYPEGVWATQLQQKYLEESKVPLDLRDLGYVSVINMVSYLPKVFTYEREGQDWKLYDARLRDKQVGKVKTQTYDETGSFGDKYVPESIYRKVLNLVRQHQHGIRSTSFLSFYEREFNTKLDLEELGFKDLEDFLELFKDKITLTKSVGHYLLLPKHIIKHLDKPPTPDEELKLPLNIEFLGPENVLRPNDEIPMQELPEIKINSKDPCEPLIEMEVRVAEVMTPSYFYLMLDSYYNELQSMMEDLEKFYNQEERNYHIMLPYLTANMYCVCKYEGLWHRAKIIGILPNKLIEIEYIDYGTPAKVKGSELRFLHSDFAKLPLQAICAKLIGINPVGRGTKWPKEACTEFLRIVTEKRLLAYVYHIGTRSSRKERTQIEIILYDTSGSKEIICNEYLVEKGLAEFANKSEEVLQENLHTSNQSASSSSQLNPPLTETMEVKRTSRVPPGFESLASPDIQGQHLMYSSLPQQSLASSVGQDGHHLLYPSLLQQYCLTNNFLIPPTNNLNDFQQYLLQSQLLNMQHMQFQGHNFRPQLPYLPINPNYNPVNSPYTAPLSPTHPYLPSPSTPQNLYQSQARHPLNINVNLQNIQNYNSSTHNRLGKIPGYSGDLSMPIPAASRTLSSQQHAGSQQESVSHLQSRTSNPTALDITNQIDQIQLTANILLSPKPLNTESSAMLRLECDEPADSKNVHNLTESVEKMNNLELDQLNEGTSNENILHSRMMPSPSLTSSLSTSDKFLSIENLTECLSEEEIEEVIPLSHQIQVLSLVNKDNRTRNKIPDSWEDIDLDDTPAKAENFSGDFKNLLEITHTEERHIKQNEESSNNLIFKTNKINSDNKLIQTKSFKNTNWKEIFNPDNTSNIESKKKCNKIMPIIEGHCLRLVHKIEFKDKFFHIIWVKNKYAVLAKEFYTQFIQNKFNIIQKLAQTVNKEFPKICRKDHQELFLELDKITLYGETVKNDVVKVGFTSISYVSDIPFVFDALYYTNPVLLEVLKVWEGHSATK